MTVEYGDFGCRYCGQFEESLTTVLNRLSAQVRCVWRLSLLAQLNLVDLAASGGLESDRFVAGLRSPREHLRRWR
jgi:hypothetical protein